MATKRSMTIFKPVYIDQRVSLSPSEFREAAADIDGHLVKKLRGSLEGQCCTHGYVRPGSTQILARSMGQAEHCRFTGDFLYQCKVKVMCLLPEAGQIVDAQVLKVNKLGAYALIVDDGRVQEAMRILVPRDLHMGNTEFDALVPEQIVRIRLLRSRFQANDAFIQAVGLYEGASTATLKAPTDKKKLLAATSATEAVTLEAAAAAPEVEEEDEDEGAAPAPVQRQLSPIAEGTEEAASA
jgi:DNA-directed RNA polymerase subunit E'/Rpb7